MHKIHVSLTLRMENSNLNGTSYKPMFMEFLKGILFFFWDRHTIFYKEVHSLETSHHNHHCMKVQVCTKKKKKAI